jgi:hypothetical protein
MKRAFYFSLFIIPFSFLFLSCTDMFDTKSSYYSTEDTNSLGSAADTVYSVIGILGKVQAIADRTVLFGELRADLVSENEYTPSDLREIVAGRVTPSNAYTDYRSFYAVINNCNYYLAKADTTVRVGGKKVILGEYAVVKAIRAWTYLQLALIYGEVPFYTQPILKFTDADRDYPKYGLSQICDYFIADLLPFVDVELPSYGTISGIDSRRFFFPVKLVLADMYLWQQDYRNAAFYYADYLSDHQLSTGLVSARVGSINTSDEVTSFTAPWISSFKTPNNEEIITLIPMARTRLDGVKSQLDNVFSSTDENDNHYQITPSACYDELNQAQDYAYSVNERTLKHLSCGDVRYFATYPTQFVAADKQPSADEWKTDDEDIRQNDKFAAGHVYVYRCGTVWLRLAEALNAMGNYDDAFAILKRGGQVTTRGDSLLFEFTQTAVGVERYRGIHARGSGEAFRNSAYDLPDMSGDTLEVRVWTRERLMDYVEDLIVDEYALESAFEGSRFYDLMRVALRRGDPTYLARKVAHRNGALQPADDALYDRLSNPSNWYIKHD